MHTTLILTKRSPGWLPSGSAPPLLGTLRASLLSTPEKVQDSNNRIKD